MENPLEFLVLAALMVLGVWLFLGRYSIKPPKPDWRGMLMHWAELNNLPELVALAKEAEHVESRLSDRAHFRIQHAGQTFNITVFAGGGVQDADRLSPHLRQ